ncbi:hypothetical protein Scep_000224 [Stephania cephalantha]|uniref:Uncharacterized protein n=1 Tax=Stephania cephalantha TaxID=152367 RepID=A0AAP0L767_9MAGN
MLLKFVEEKITVDISYKKEKKLTSSTETNSCRHNSYFKVRHGLCIPSQNRAIEAYSLLVGAPALL